MRHAAGAQVVDVEAVLVEDGKVGPGRAPDDLLRRGGGARRLQVDHVGAAALHQVPGAQGAVAGTN